MLYGLTNGLAVSELNGLLKELKGLLNELYWEFTDDAYKAAFVVLSGRLLPVASNWPL